MTLVLALMCKRKADSNFGLVTPQCYNSAFSTSESALGCLSRTAGMSLL